MGANAHDTARGARHPAHAGGEPTDLGSLDHSLSQLEAKLSALQSRADAPREPVATARRVRVGAPSLDPHAALSRIEDSFGADPRPAPTHAASPDTTARELARLREEIGREVGHRMETLGREIGALRNTVASGAGNNLEGEFARVYRGLEAVADALDKQGDTDGMARDVATLKRDLDALVRQNGGRDDALGKLIKSQNAVLQAQGGIERALATHRSAVDPELAAIRAQLDDVARRVGSDKNAAAMEGVDRRLVALGKTLAEVKRVAGEGPDLRALEAKLEDLARVVVAAAQSVPEIDVAPIERIEARVASHHRRVDERDKRREQLDQRRVEETNGRIDALREDARGTGAAVRELATGLEERLAKRFDGFTETVRDEHGRLAMDVVAATGPRIAAVGDAVERVGGEIEGWNARLDGWGQRLQKEMGRPRDAEVNMFKALAARLDAVSDRLAELPDAQHDARNFGAIEQRVSAVLQRLEAVSHGGGMDREAIDELRSQLGSIAWRIEQPAEPPAVLTTLDARVQALTSRIESLAAANAEIASDVQAMGARVDGTRGEGGPVDLGEDAVERIGARVETSLTRRLDELTNVLNRTTAPLADLAPRLDALEETMGDAQVALVETARTAAAEVVSAMLENQGDMVPAEAEAVAALDGDIRRLEELTVGQDERNSKTFDAVHETLLKIVDRLDQLDTMVARATEAPDPAVMAATHAALMQSAPASGAAPSLMDRLRGRGGAPGGGEAPEPVVAAPTAPSVAPQADDEPGSIFADLDPDTPLDPLTGDPRVDGLGMNGHADDDGEPTVDGIVANVRRSEADDAHADDFMAVARKKARVADNAEFAGLGLKGDADDKGKRGKNGRKNKSKGKDAPKADNDGGSALARHRRPMLMAAAVAIAALIAMPQIIGAASGVLDGIAPGSAAPDEPVLADLAAPVPMIDEPDVIAGEDVPLSAPETDPEEAVDLADAPAAVDPIETQALLKEESVAETRAAIRDVTPKRIEAPMPTVAAPAVPAAPSSAPLTASGPVTDIAIEDTDGPAALRDAARGGDARALHEIAGRIASTDAERAFELYEAAAARGLAPAQYRLGQAYEKGYGTPVDLAAARRWYGVAAEAGNASAMHNLAVLYAMGADGTRDVTLAGRWFTKAANLGVKDSQYNLGILHAQGSGVAEDLTESYKWFDAAAKNGDADAGTKRDEVGGAMSASQLASAKAKAASWSAAIPAVAANEVVVPPAWRTASLAPEDMTRAVRNVQAILNRSGFDAGKPDGVMGKKTRTAILEFQRANGLSVTGEIDDALVKALLEKNEA